MPEKLSARLDDVPAQFAISALTLASEEARSQVFADRQGKGNNEVQLLLNGVEVPFHATITDWWQRCEADLNSRAAEIAMEKFDRLKEIGDFIDQLNRDFRYRIKQRIEEAFGVKLRDND